MKCYSPFNSDPPCPLPKQLSDMIHSVCWERWVGVKFSFFSLLAWRFPDLTSNKMNELDEFFSFHLSPLTFWPSRSFLSLQPSRRSHFYGSHEKRRHQRMTLLGYYELMWSKRGKRRRRKEGRDKTLVMDHKLHFLWNDAIWSGCQPLLNGWERAKTARPTDEIEKKWEDEGQSGRNN